MRVLLRVNVGTATPVTQAVAEAAAASLASWPVDPDDGIDDAAVPMMAGTLRHLINHLMMRAFRSTIDGSPMPG